ncbi:MAG: 5'/3'-nucleotidase SurE [Acidobacteriota bacterium]|nr:MAG: 5'/3'-nucleotidase SurE [Acidobacteriota bacterium]
MTDPDVSILVTNDDGVRAAGLDILARELTARWGKVTVVAPDREQSGASHALTIRTPLRVDQLEDGWYAVEGTPTDCVNLAFFNILDRPPDVVVSGINAGFNLGEDVTYSGTVAGALEARILGSPSLALSTDSRASEEQLTVAARIAVRLTELVLGRGLTGDAFLNVNVPLEPRGYCVTRQGRRSFRKGPISRRDPKGREYYWIGLAPSEWHADAHADHTAVGEGLVSVTPLHSDLTFHRAIPEVEAWQLPEREAP